MTDLARAVLLAGLMAGASLLAWALQPRVYLADRVAQQRLADWVPQRFGDWQVDPMVVPVPPSPDVQRVLDATYDETLARTYRHAGGARVMLSLAYARNQHKGMNTHRPEICYPAQGFRIAGGTQDGRLAWGGGSIPVQRLVAELGPRHEPITYWLRVGGTITPFGYAQRRVTIGHGLRGEVPDGVLVRLSSIDLDTVAAYRMHERFVRDLLAHLGDAERARLLGDGS